MKNLLIEIMESAKSRTVNGSETIEFTVGAFTQLYDEALKLKKEHRQEVKVATLKGVVIGITLVGLIEFGVDGYYSLKERYLDDVYQKIDGGVAELVEEAMKSTDEELDELEAE